ncbi:hypothetical protein SteCoe_35693 [Stentor coeruleus]|uniref:Uncharacterized protein n=1 Tax=Stentor coeruleus TaxID=5963 RepID=A0A1R2ARN4_9CILI|nr:hypothetical protein SteCoe_35693 [Stentor coeruleus]
MNITDDLKSTLNKTLEIALGIEKVNTMINPRKAHTEGKNLVNVIYKDMQILTNYTRGRKRQNNFKEVKETPRTISLSLNPNLSEIRRADLKKNLSSSIKKVTQRVKMSRAGKRTIGQLLHDEHLPFNQSFDKALSSRVNTPKPKSLPFVSLTTGKIENPMYLPDFQEYLENKGSNYLKKKYNDDILGRFDKASNNISKFKDDFEYKASNYIKAIDDKSKRASLFRKPSNAIMVNELNISTVRRRSLVIKNLIFNANSTNNKNTQKAAMNKTQPVFSDTVRGFNQASIKENQKFLDILNKIDLERPMILRQKVELIQGDKERYKNNLHSLKKFEKFRILVETQRRKRQNMNYRQGLAYMNIIEGFRTLRYKPSSGEMEVLEFWKRMVEYGWVVTQADLDEVRDILSNKGTLSESSELLIEKLSKVINP